jgi:hypothetical protein
VPSPRARPRQPFYGHLDTFRIVFPEYTSVFCVATLLSALMAEQIRYVLQEGLVELPEDPIKYGHFRSTNSRSHCSIFFRNISDRQLRIVWVDFNGRPIQYHLLDPGFAYWQHTYDTHPWVWEDLSGDVFGSYVGACDSYLMPCQCLSRGSGRTNGIGTLPWVVLSL